MRRKKRARNPLCIVIAGPNGAGKTTFARRFLPRDAGILHFVNSDVIAAGISLRPDLARWAAGRLFLRELDRLAAARESFAFETTLSGRVYLSKLKRWKASGYHVEVIFVRLTSPALALKRIANRVREGGHGVPAVDVRRRFARGWHNFQTLYRPIADQWALWDNSGLGPRRLEVGP